MARGKDNDARILLDQAVSKYRYELAKRTTTTDDDSVRAQRRICESRLEKQKRIQERESTFERNKQGVNGDRDRRELFQRASDLQQLRAQTRIANTGTARAALQARQSTQVGVLINLFARS